MKKLLIAAVLVGLAASAGAHPATNAREKMGLSGQVREFRSVITDEGLIMHNRYEFNAEGELVKTETEDALHAYKASYSYVRDADDQLVNITRIVEVYGADGVLSGTSREWEDFFYDDQGKLTSSASYKDDNPEDEYWWEGPLLASQSRTDASGDLRTTAYEYDDNSRLIKELHYRNKDELLDWTEYENDDRGLPVSVANWDGQGRLMGKYAISYEYDERGNIILQTNTRNRGNGIRISSAYTYFSD